MNNEQMRAEFEAANSHRPLMREDFQMADPDVHHRYYDSETQAAWEGWEQAMSRRATSGAASGEVVTDSLVHRIADSVMTNLEGRKGIFADVDDEIMQEIRDDLGNTIRKALAAPAEQSAPPVPPLSSCIPPSRAEPAGQHEACITCGAKVGGIHASNCVYEGEAMEGFPGKGAAGARKLVGYGDCKCTLSRHCDGLCNPIWADEASGHAGAAKGGITNEEILAAMRPELDEADGGYSCDTQPERVIAAGRALLATQSASTAPGQAETERAAFEAWFKAEVASGRLYDADEAVVLYGWQARGQSAIAALSKEKP